MPFRRTAISKWLIVTLTADSSKHLLSVWVHCPEIMPPAPGEKKTIAFSLLVLRINNIYKRSVRDGALLHFLKKSKKKPETTTRQPKSPGCLRGSPCRGHTPLRLRRRPGGSRPQPAGTGAAQRLRRRHRGSLGGRTGAARSAPRFAAGPGPGRRAGAEGRGRPAPPRGCPRPPPVWARPSRRRGRLRRSAMRGFKRQVRGSQAHAQPAAAAARR